MTIVTLYVLTGFVPTFFHSMFISSFLKTSLMVTNIQVNKVTGGGLGHALFSFHAVFYICVLYVVCSVTLYYVLHVIFIIYSVDTNCNCARNIQGRVNYLNYFYGGTR